jgi:hypothetical protein
LTEPADPSPSIPSLPPSEAIAADLEGGTKEARQIALGLSEDQLRRLAAEGEHNRNEKFRDHFEKIALCTLWLAWGLIVLVALAWLYHLMTPVGWHWLDDDHVSKLQTLVTGGVIAGIAGGHIKRRLGA